ncbi:MAG: GGDEF domain-containing protein [Syntrophaceae bacterium]|nr:GGDEF domain-containing protein [Deltaproteobacteria bacterium]
MKAIISLFLPGGLLVLASLFLVHLGGVKAHLDTIAGVYPYVVYIGAMLLGWRFNRSALVFGTVSIALAHWCLALFTPGMPGAEITSRIAYDAVTLLLPLNLLVLSLVKERGFITPWGIGRLSLILGQPLMVGLIVGPDPWRFAALLEYEYLPWGFLSLQPVSQTGIAVCIATLALLGFRSVRSCGAKESGFFWAAAACFAALSAAGQGPVMSFHFATASLILLVSVVEVSHTMAFRDELTGLPARRALKEDLLKLPGQYCLAMLDIDHFKKFNDRYGHDVGDQVLRMVASKLDRITGGGKAFRYGGEEFTVIFPGRYADDALDHLEEIRKEVASSAFMIRSGFRPKEKPRKPKARGSGGKRVSVTISIGAAWPGSRSTTPNEVLKEADKALYRAKKQGRNRVAG